MKAFIYSFVFLYTLICQAQIISNEEIKELKLNESFDYANKVSKEMLLAFNQGNFTIIDQYFDDNLNQNLPPEKLSSTWKQITDQYGSFQAVLNSKIKLTAEKTYYLSGFELAKQKFDLQFTLTDSNKLSSFKLLPYTSPNNWEAPKYANTEKINKKSIELGSKYPLKAEYVFPKHEEEFPIVVMVHGSGPNDMDGSLGPNKIFKDLAYGLASMGIGSIRYNKRTYDYSSQLHSQINDLTIDQEVTNDAVAAIELAKSYQRGKVILLGHSLGGHMTPKIASKIKVDGVVVMAGNASPLIDLIVPQFEYLVENDSTTSINEFQLNAMKYQVKNVKENNYDSSTVGPMLPFGLSGVYWKSLEGYKPPKLAKKQDQPFLILNGERDYQVTSAEAKKWKNGNKHELSKTIIYPKLNHMFYAGEGLLLPAEYEIEAHLEEKVLSDIVSFIERIEKE